jgi:phosphate transport system protein
MVYNSLLAKEIHKLKSHFLLLGGKVEEQFSVAVEALRTRDCEKARKVVDEDREVDLMEVNLEEECLKVLALHQPVAGDLRFIITVLKVNSDLERIGDMAVNISKAVLFLDQNHDVPMPQDYIRMATLSGEMLKNSLNAMVEQDMILAEKVRQSDDEVDAIHAETFRVVAQSMRKNPDHTESHLQYMSISSALERVGDLACNIAEDVIYLSDGAIVRHWRS